MKSHISNIRSFARQMFDWRRALPYPLVLLSIVGAAAGQAGSSSNPALVGQPVNLLFTLNFDLQSVAPTGTVNFNDGANQLAAVMLQANGTAIATATATVSFTAAGDHSITATYSGDSNYLGFTTPPFTQTILDDNSFTMNVNPLSVTEPVGAAASVELSLFSLATDPSAVTLNCEGLPPGAACAFSPATVIPSGAGTSSTLTITTTGKHRIAWFRRMSPTFAFLALLPLSIVKRRRALFLLFGLLAFVAFAGCGKHTSFFDDGTPPGTYTVNLVAGDGNIVRQSALTLNVD